MSRVEWDLLVRYVAGESTPAEREQLERWLAEDPAHAEMLAGVRGAATLAGKSVDPERRAATLARLRADRRAEAARPLAPRIRPFPGYAPRPRWVAALRAAAAIVLLVGGGLIARAVWQASVQEAAVTYSVVSATRGQRLSIRLPDSTLVVLAPGTTLRTPSTYGAHDRIVHLEGEAAFTVVHDEARPFSVRTARAVARDLGTRFVVRAYAGDTSTDVVVAEGVVAVGRADSASAPLSTDSLVIARGERVRVDAEGRLALTRDVSLDRYFGWTEGRLVFEDTPLDEVAAQLGRWYDVEVQLASDGIRSLPVTASFEHQPVQDALRRIALSLGLELSQTDRTFTLSAR